MSASRSRPVRVAVVGGGCAAMAAAFELTRPELGGAFEVTVYQQGWRLGGKGASGRGVGGRIEEHGLHVWQGWYDNAFRLMRECYAELGRDPATHRIAEWTDAFFPLHDVGLADRSPGGLWSAWSARFPDAAGLPGDPLPRDAFSPHTYMLRTVGLLRTLLASAQSSVRESSGGGVFSARPASSAAGAPPGQLQASIARYVRYGQGLSLAFLLEGVELLAAALRRLGSHWTDLQLQLLDALEVRLRGLFFGFLDTDPELRRIWEAAEIIVAMMRGVLQFDLLRTPDGFDAIDGYDFREWLLRCGADGRAVDSALVRALYDMAFAYEDGCSERPRFSAAVVLRGCCRFFLTYRGALLWKMRAGMGDVVFAPLYEVLSRRGVAFSFFHRLEHVGLHEGAPGASRVATLDFAVQAEVRGGGEYRPLRDVDGLPCWPSSPDLSQLVGARRDLEHRSFEDSWDRRDVGRLRLAADRDFDAVVLGIGLGAVPEVCAELVEADPRWRAMVEHLGTTATQAFQIWLEEDLETLGWSGASTVTGHADPVDSWADMSHLIAEEPGVEGVRGIAYFCGVLESEADPADREAAEREEARVLEESRRHLDVHMTELWPGARDAEGGFRSDLLAGDVAAAGDEREEGALLRAQFHTANINPSDRYVLSLPGSQTYRISPLDAEYGNLAVAGDWTDCGYNVGCVEAAVISGRLAAHAIAGTPALEDIPGYDHP